MEDVVALIDTRVEALKIRGLHAPSAEGGPDRAMQRMTPEWLFDHAGVTGGGSVAWGQAVPEHGPGVYIITTAEPGADGQIVVYIGRSKHLRRRLREF